MSALSFIHHPDTGNHDTGPGHPERPERLTHLVGHLLDSDLWRRMEHHRPDPCSRENILRVHPESYVHWIEDSIESGVGLLDSGDTRVSSGSLKAALLAAGGACLAVDRACGAERHHAFAAGRPPGHHAETTKAMGFCLFNNVAVAARYAQARYGVGKVAIVDWDVNHGNGTQEIFWSDPSVLYVSTHQFPLWPGSGSPHEQGEGAGAGLTLNCPMPPGSGEDEYAAVFQDKIIPALRAFKPDLLMISAGFDAHHDDPLANILLRDSSFGMLTRMLLAVRPEAGIVSVLEGGYNLDALARSVEIHLRTLLEA